MMRHVISSTILADAVASNSIKLVDFADSYGSALDFTTNGEGGGAHEPCQSIFDIYRHEGSWSGGKEEGYCHLYSPTMRFPDISGTEGIIVKARQGDYVDRENFTLSIVTSALKSGSWRGRFELQSDTVMEYFIPYSEFGCFDDDGALTTCGSLADQLGDVTQVGLDNNDPRGFVMWLSSISAVGGSAVVV